MRSSSTSSGVPGVVHEPASLAEGRSVRFLRDDGPRLGVDERGRLPVREVERVALREEDRELPALGAEPEPVFSAERVDVRPQLTRGHELVVDPAETARGRAAGGRGHHAALPRRDDRHPAAGRVLQDQHLDVLPQERDVLVERAPAGAGGRGDRHRGRQAEGRDDARPPRPESAHRTSSCARSYPGTRARYPLARAPRAVILSTIRGARGHPPAARPSPVVLLEVTDEEPLPDAAPGHRRDRGRRRRQARRRAEAARRVRHLGPRHLGRPLRRLLPVRVRRLAQGQPDPARPDPVGPLQRARGEKPRGPPPDPRGGEGPRGEAVPDRGEGRRLLRGLHGRGRRSRPGAASPSTRSWDESTRSSRRPTSSASSARTRGVALPTLFRFGSAPDLHDSTRTIAIGRPGRPQPARPRRLPEGRRQVEGEAGEVPRARGSACSSWPARTRRRRRPTRRRSCGSRRPSRTRPWTAWPCATRRTATTP